MPQTHERRAQKSRTREALLEGARALMLEGVPVSVTAAAERANISKATAYRYFSDPGVMAAEAGLAVEVKPYEEIVADAQTPAEKLRAISLYFFDLAIAHEAAFRQFLARSQDAWGAEDGRLRSRRGARRVAMFETALAGPDCTIGTENKARLVRALTVATGAEAMVALLDVARADRASARQAVCDITDALIVSHLTPRNLHTT